jgi:hypothetical protein
MAMFYCLKFETPQIWGSSSQYLYIGTGCHSQSYVTIDDQSVSLPLCQVPIWRPWPRFYYCRTVAGLLICRCPLWLEGGSVVYPYWESKQSDVSTDGRPVSQSQTALMNRCSLLSPQKCFLATAIVLFPDCTAVTWQRVCMPQYDLVPPGSLCDCDRPHDRYRHMSQLMILLTSFTTASMKGQCFISIRFLLCWFVCYQSGALLFRNREVLGPKDWPLWMSCLVIFFFLSSQVLE